MAAQQLLEGRTAFVTGSTLGIGREMASAIVAAGADVVLHGLTNDPEAQEALAVCGPNAKLVTGDLSANLPECAVDIAASAIDLAPDIDLLVCNAGTYIDQPFLEMDYDTFDRTMKLNVYSQFVLVQAFAKRWKQSGTRGRIIITGSINGRLAEQTHVAYDTSKGAVESMVRSLAVTLAPEGIRVNGIAPGLFRTPLTEPALQHASVRSWMQLHTPNGQVPGPEVVRGTTVYLLSEAADHVHGQMLFVDGGMSVWQQPDPPSTWTG